MKNFFRSILMSLMILSSCAPAYAVTPTNIKTYSETAASNNNATPNGAPTGWAPSTVGPTVRQIMAEIRRWYDDPAWVDHGDTYTYVGATSFKISGIDDTALYPVGMRLRAVGSSTGTIYGTIATSAYSTDTTITVTWDSGSLSNETLAISRGFPTAGAPIAASAVSGFTPVTDTTITMTSSSTVNNATTSAHGWMPILSNSATLYYDSLGTQTNPALNAVLTGYSSGAGTVGSTDTVLAAIQKLNGNVAAIKTPTLGSPISFNSSTSATIASSIPAGVTRINIMFNQATFSAVAAPLIQLGTSGGTVSTGYFGGDNEGASYTTGFGVFASGEGNKPNHTGTMTLTLADATNNIWVMTYNLWWSTQSVLMTGAGRVALSGALTSLNFTTVAGTANWNGGTVSVSYQ